MKRDDLSELVSLLAAPERSRRFAAACELGRISRTVEGAEEGLVRLLDDPEVPVRVAAAHTLRGRYLGRATTVDALAGQHDHPNRVLRAAIAHALGNCGRGFAPRAEAALVAALGDEDDQVRDEAVRSLSLLDLPRPAVAVRRPSPLPTCRPEVTLKIWIGGELVGPAAIFGRLDECCERFLEESPHPSGGFWLEADGVPCHGDGYPDDVEWARGWFYGLVPLLEGAMEARTLVREQSNLVLHRVGDQVQVEDVHCSGHVLLARTAFPLRALGHALLTAGRDLSRWRRGMLARLGSRAALEGWRPASGRPEEPDEIPAIWERLDELHESLEHDVDEDLALLEARLGDD